MTSASKPQGRRWRLAGLVLAVLLLAGFVALRPPRETGGEVAARPIAAAGLLEVDFTIVGGSRVVDVVAGQFKESLVTVQGGDLHGSGTLARVAEQIQGQPITCLGETYDDPGLWMSTTPATGVIDFVDAGSITISVTIVEVVKRPLAVDPICQDIVGTYRGASGSLSDVTGTLASGIAADRPQFWVFDPADEG